MKKKKKERGGGSRKKIQKIDTNLVSLVNVSKNQKWGQEKKPDPGRGGEKRENMQPIDY